MRPRVLLADDHALVREGIQALLGRMSDVEVIGQAADGQDAVNLVLKHKVYIRTVELAGFKGLRASLHAYNGSEDVARLVAGLRAVRAELAA